MAIRKVAVGEVLEQPLLIDKDGWIIHPDFIRIDGIADKVYSQKNSGDEGLACHSIVGEETLFQDGVPDRFISLAKTADGRYTPYAAASCMFILRKEGKHIQMYPITASTWTSGSGKANVSTWAMEAEGGGYVRGVPNFSEPLTVHQENGFLIIATAWEQQKLRGCEVGKTARAHKDLVKAFGGNPTACESGRYRNAWDRLANGERWVATEEADMTPEQLEEHRAIVAILGGREKLLAAAKGGMDYLLGYAIEQREQNDLEERVAALEAMKPEPRVKVIQAVSSALINAGEEIGRAGGTE